MKMDEETELPQCMVGGQETMGIKKLRKALTGCEGKLFSCQTTKQIPWRGEQSTPNWIQP